MIAGRLPGGWPPVSSRRNPALLALEFDAGTLVLTEAGTQRRASLHLLAGREALAAADLAAWSRWRPTRQLRRAPEGRETTPQARADRTALFSGIGNAYSDEIPIARALRRSR